MFDDFNLDSTLFPITVGRKRHIGKDQERAFCGNTIIQKTKSGNFPLELVSPDECTCRICLTSYYWNNPLRPVITRSSK